jgi:hypothetical protein
VLGLFVLVEQLAERRVDAWRPESVDDQIAGIDHYRPLKGGYEREEVVIRLRESSTNAEGNWMRNFSIWRGVTWTFPLIRERKGVCVAIGLRRCVAIGIATQP